MMIKKLELQGFKSFPERTKIVFHPGITAVIGPNGTGKSNIVDAILWVLGGQRQKSSRGEKIEDIIFNGNTKMPPLGMADVHLYLGNKEEELVINHRAFRSGESEYRLDGKTARLKDIQEALSKKSIAEKEYFVIEQGSIGLFVTSKPSEKRAMLEEAAGTAYYKDRKKQAQNKLESTEQNLIRLEDIIVEVTRAKNSLQRQAQGAARYRKLRERIRHLKALHYLRRMDLLESSREDAASRHNKCLEQERGLLFRVKTGEKELAVKKQELRDLEKSLKEGREALFSLKTQETRVETDIDKAGKRIEFLREERKRAGRAAAELRQELDRLNKEIGQGTAHLQDLERELGRKEQDLKAAELESRSTRGKMEARENELQSLKDDHLKKLSELTETGNEAAGVERELELVRRQGEKLRKKIEEGKALLEEKEKKLERLRQEFERRKQEKEDKEKETADLRKKLERTLAETESVTARVSERQQKKERLGFEIQALKKMEEKERGSGIHRDMPGAIGLLADLIEADAEIAPLIDLFWEEETKAVLIRVSDFLEKRETGEIKSRILLLPGQAKPEPRREIDGEQGVIGRLKSRLRLSPNLGNTPPWLEDAVIVRDIVTAVRLWLRHPETNFITPDGDILLSSGFLKPGRKKEGILTLGQEVKRLEGEVSLLDRELSPLVSLLDSKKWEKKILEEKLKEIETRHAALENEARQMEREMSLEEAERENISRSLTLLLHEEAILENDRRTLVGRKKTLAGTISRLQESALAVKDKMESEEKAVALDRKKEGEEGRQFLEIKAACSLIREKISGLTGRIEGLTRAVDTAGKKTAALEEEIRDSEEEESRLREVIQNLTRKAGEVEEERKEKERELARLESESRAKKSELDEREAGLEKLRESLESLKEERVRWEVAKAERDRDLVNLEETCWQELKKNLAEIKAEIPAGEMPDAAAEEELMKAEEELQKYKAVNLMAEEEYLGQKERLDFLIKQKNDLIESIKATNEAIRKIDEESRNRFLGALTEVNRNFQEVFALLFQGGRAEVRLIDPENPLESGIDVVAQPPGKKLQNMSLLSGGEKSLTSLAFLFALFRYRPTPFCILDEVDAQLDEVNLARFLELMKKIKKETQFIIITHNYKTMEVADYIYGTTMDEPNITRIFSVKLEKKEAE